MLIRLVTVEKDGMEKVEFTWKSVDDLTIFARAWTPDLPPKAVIVLVHGLGEHIGRYEHVAQMFTDHQYAFVGADLIGQENLAVTLHVDSFDDFYNDIDKLIKETDDRFPGVPRILYGHSLGANLVLYYAIKRDPTIAGMIVSSPGLDITRDPPQKYAIGKLKYTMYPRFSLTNSLDTTGLSHDQAVVKAYLNDPLVHPMISARAGLDLINLGKWLRENSISIKAPILLVHGDNDRLANISGTREFVKHFKGDLEYIEFPGGYHKHITTPTKMNSSKNACFISAKYCPRYESKSQIGTSV